MSDNEESLLMSQPATMMLLLVLASILCSSKVFCYYASETHYGGHCGHIEQHHRVLCEGSQISESECLTRGCCWDATNHPRCYMGNVAYKKSGISKSSYHGALYPLSNALDGIDPTGLDPRNCAFINASNSEHVEIYLGGRYLLHSVSLHNKDETLHDLFIRTKVDYREWSRCGDVGDVGSQEWVNTECEVPRLADTIRIERNYRYNWGPLYLCQIYASGVDYEPTCSVIPQNTRLQCGSPTVSRDECIASNCCYNSTASPACFQSNIAYGKSVAKYPPNIEDQIITDGIMNSDKYFAMYTLARVNSTITIDLEKTTSVSSVIIHVMGTSYTPAPTTVFVSQDADYTSSSAKICGSASVPINSPYIFVRCSSPVTGRYVTISFMVGKRTYVKEVVVTGGSTRATTFGSVTLKGWGAVDARQAQAILIPDRTEAFQGAIGTVTGWKVSVQETKPIHLAFWRPNGGGYFTYVGGTDFTPPGTEIYEIKLTADQQFDIQQGDVVGVEWRQGGVVRFNNKNRCRANDVKHLIHAYPSSTHSKTTPVYFGEHTKCGQYQIHALVNQ